METERNNRLGNYRQSLLFTVLSCMLALAHAESIGKTVRPNVLIFIADDLGYGDVGTFGNTSLPTPHLDRLAAQGAKLTHNIAADTVCTPSRAAFLTGRYPIRSGMAASHPMRVIMFTASSSGLPATEITFGEIASEAGYKTAFLGKWHMGWSLDRSDPDHRHPLNQGFQYFYGVPTTNVMDFGDHNERMLLLAMPRLPRQLLFTYIAVAATAVFLARVGLIRRRSCFLIVFLAGLLCWGIYWLLTSTKLLNSFMFRNYEMVEQPIHLPTVTRKLVMESEHFLKARNQDGQPFLLVVSWLHVHDALATAPKFKGRSRHGPYGDAVMEMDWGVGEVVDTLDRLGLADNTFVYFTSDHGGCVNITDWMGRQVGGYNGPFRGTKAQGSPEGAFRVPGIVRWPGHVPAGQVISEPVSLMDVLPTVADLLHVPLRQDRFVDGKSLLPLVTGSTHLSLHEFLLHYCQDEVHAIRYRPRTGNKVWKLSLREPRDYSTSQLGAACTDVVHLDPPHLYDVISDPAEKAPLHPKHFPEVVSAMLSALADHKQSVVAVSSQFTISKLMWIPWKQSCCNFPSCTCQDKQFLGMFRDE